MSEYIEKLQAAAEKEYNNVDERNVLREMVLAPLEMYGDRDTILFSTPSETR